MIRAYGIAVGVFLLLLGFQACNQGVPIFHDIFTSQTGSAVPLPHPGPPVLKSITRLNGLYVNSRTLVRYRLTFSEPVNPDTINAQKVHDLKNAALGWQVTAEGGPHELFITPTAVVPDGELGNATPILPSVMNGLVQDYEGLANETPMVPDGVEETILDRLTPILTMLSPLDGSSWPTAVGNAEVSVEVNFHCVDATPVTVEIEYPGAGNNPMKNVLKDLNCSVVKGGQNHQTTIQVSTTPLQDRTSDKTIKFTARDAAGNIAKPISLSISTAIP